MSNDLIDVYLRSVVPCFIMQNIPYEPEIQDIILLTNSNTKVRTERKKRGQAVQMYNIAIGHVQKNDPRTRSFPFTGGDSRVD